MDVNEHETIQHYT